MEKIKTIEGFEVEINDDPLETGKPYVFREKDSDDWWYNLDDDIKKEEKRHNELLTKFQK